MAVGRDARSDSVEFASQFIAGLAKQGREIWDLGLITTDMLFFAIGRYDLSGGGVISASHNPVSDNGLKLAREEAISVGLGMGLEEIRDSVLANEFKPAAAQVGKVISRNVTDEWLNFCFSFIDKLKPFHVAIDTGNGTAGAILPKLLPKLPLKVEPLYFKVNGKFPNHAPNPSEAENINDLIALVKRKRLDLGIAFDGDGDRAVFVDDLGRVVQGSDIISIIAKYYLKRHPGSKIVHDVRTSRATQELIKEWGGKPIRVKAGRIVVGAEMRRLGAPFGAETSGHMFFKEHFYSDSGLITAMVLLEALSESEKKLSAIVDEYRHYEMISETNFVVKNKELAIANAEAAFKGGRHDHIDGVTVNYPDYWFNLRPSNTEQLVRLNAEAKTRKQLDELVAKLKGIITDS